ncbi:hypothetical protein [Gordonia sp. NPDC003376]
MGQPIYLCGFLCQVAGFVLAFFARERLPLYLVQSAVCASVGVTAVLGMAVLRWHVPATHWIPLGVLAVAVGLLAAAAEPSVAVTPDPATTMWLAAGLLAAAVLSVGAARLRSGVTLAVLAGVVFAILAVAGRPLVAQLGPGMLWHPLTWLTLACAGIGQVQMAAALQRSPPTVVGAVMDSVTMIVASALGVIALGDRIRPGDEPMVAAGVVLTLVGVAALARYGDRVDSGESTPPERSGVGAATPQQSMGRRARE